MINEMIQLGYCVSPNNIHSLPGTIMYAAGPGVRIPENHFSVQVLNDRIRVFDEKFFGQQYSRQSHWDTITIAVFDTVTDFSQWCTAISVGGGNHITGPNVYD